MLLHLVREQLGAKKVHFVRTRGGNTKRRALKLDHGNFSWGSERVSRKSKIIDVVYNASNNELVRTKILVKNSVVVIDATPFRLWYENYYRTALPVKTTGQNVRIIATPQPPSMLIISQADETNFTFTIFRLILSC
jgi:small subunit ribosomal protein S8e